MKYLFDRIGVVNSYLVCASFCIVCLIIILGAATVIPHNKRQFFERDPALSYYNKDNDIVTVYMLYSIIFPIPIGIITIGCLPFFGM
jgi:hypothetical protein